MNFQFSSNNTKCIKQEKEKLIQAGYPVSSVIEFIKTYLNVEAYRLALEKQDNIYLVMPSTSGRNIIPKYVAARLQYEFGGQIIVDFARPMHETKTANLSAIGKIREQRVYEVRKQPFKDLNIKNKNLVLVDDVVSTGVSIKALEKALNESGIQVTTVLSIAQTDKRITSKRDIERFAEKLEQEKNSAHNVKNDVALLFKGTLKHHLNTIEREITGPKKSNYRREVYEYVKREAVRIRDEVKTPGRIQQGSEGKTKLYQRGVEGSSGLPVGEGKGFYEGHEKDPVGLATSSSNTFRNKSPKWYTFIDKRSGKEYPVFGYRESLETKGIFISAKKNTDNKSTFYAVTPDGRGESKVLFSSSNVKFLRDNVIWTYVAWNRINSTENKSTLGLDI